MDEISDFQSETIKKAYDDLRSITLERTVKRLNNVYARLVDCQLSLLRAEYECDHLETYSKEQLKFKKQLINKIKSICNSIDHLKQEIE